MKTSRYALTICMLTVIVAPVLVRAAPDDENQGPLRQRVAQVYGYSEQVEVLSDVEVLGIQPTPVTSAHPSGHVFPNRIDYPVPPPAGYAHPSFEVRKDALIADGGLVVDAVGDRIDYCVVVENCGNCPLTVLHVLDALVDLHGPVLPAILPAGASLKFVGHYFVQPADLHHPSIKNLVTVSTKEAGTKRVGVAVPVACPAPAHCDFAVEKLSKVVDGHPYVDKPGDRIHYAVTITNTGDGPITLVDIVDTLVVLGGPKLPAILACGESVFYSGEYCVTQDDLCLSAIQNLVTVTTKEAGPKSDVAIVPVKKTDCTDCGCKKCCTWVLEERVKIVPKCMRKCYIVHEPETRTTPYCFNKCTEDGKCIEVLGTKTVREFVPHHKIEYKDDEDVKIVEEWIYKCLKCGVHISDCPHPPH